MKTKLTYLKFSLLLGFSMAEAVEPAFDLQQIRVTQDQISTQLRTDYPNFNEAEAASKITQFSSMLTQIGSIVYDKSWVYSGNANLPVIDWSHVDKIGSFVEDQDKPILNDSVIVVLANQTNDEAARLGLMSGLLHHYCAEGSDWFGLWLQAKAKSNDANLKWFVYKCVDDFSEDYHTSDQTSPREELVVDWVAWKSSFDQSNKLGKALLLKCMTRLAITTESWDKLKEMHLSVFNGKDDDLKAIALVKGNSKLGDTVIAKWTDLAENSTNAKLKSLAEQAISRHTGEAEDLE